MLVRIIFMAAYFFAMPLIASSKFGMETVHALRSIAQEHGRIEDCEEGDSLIVAQAHVVGQETEIVAVSGSIRAQRAATTCEICMAGCFLTCYPIPQSQEEQSEHVASALQQAYVTSDCMSHILPCNRPHNLMQR